MREVQLRDAKAGLSALVTEARDGTPSVITRHGRPEAVVIGFEEWQRLSALQTFGRFLWEAPFEEGDVPDRHRTTMRAADL